MLYQLSYEANWELVIEFVIYSLSSHHLNGYITNSHNDQLPVILGDPGAASRDEGIFVGESLLQQVDEPLGTYSHRTCSRSIWISRFWLARKIFFWPINEEDQPCLLTQSRFPHRSQLRGPFKGGILDEIFTKVQRSRANRKLNMAAGKYRENFHGGLIKGIVKFYG